MRSLVLGMTLAVSAPAQAKTLHGLVYDDRNGDGRPSAGEPGVSGAVVAFGVARFAVTNSAGEFELWVPQREVGILWARVPDGFVPGPVWARVDVAAQTTPVELGLRPLAAAHRGPLTFVVAADTHLAPSQPFGADLAAVADAATALDPPPAFFTILGDVTQSNKDDQFDLVDANLAGLDVPFIPVPGNHDWYDGGETWFRRYGPDNYSFDIDDVHFVVWNMAMAEEDIERYLGAELAHVASRMTVIALTHAPPTPVILRVLRRLGVDYVLTGHTHTNRAVDHGGLIELTTEPLLMGGLDLMPAGYRVVTIDRSRLTSYHRTIVDEPVLSLIAPAAGTCVPKSGGAFVVAAELDAGTADLSVRIDCATPMHLRFTGGWSWRVDLPALTAGTHSYVVEARTPSKSRTVRSGTFRVCQPQARDAPIAAAWSQLGGNARHTGSTDRVIAPPLITQWTATVGGHVLHAAPAIGDGAVFVTATDLGDGHTGGLAAIELATGALRWRTATPAPARGAPAIAHATVAIGQLDGTVHGLDVRTGDVRWRYELGADLAPEAASLFASATADSGDFLIGNQRHLASIASDVGTAFWTADPVPDGAYSQSLAAVAVADGIAVGVFHRELGGVIAWDRATGNELWRVEGELATAINATPVIGGDTVFVVNGLTEVIALELTTGATRWRVKLDPAGFDWANATIGTPAIAHGVLVVPTLYRDLVGLDAASGTELWRFAGTPSPLRTTHYRGAREAGFEASPVITGDVVWAADTAGRLSALELRSGRALWHMELGAPVLAGLAVAGDWLVVATYDGSVRALVPTDRAPRVRSSAATCDVVARTARTAGTGCCDARDAVAPLAPVLAAAYVLRRRRRRSTSSASPTGHAIPPVPPGPEPPTAHE